MMRNGCLNKGLVVGIIALFLIMSVTSSISGNIGQKSKQLTEKVVTSFPLNDGLLAYWKSDECDGITLWDCSGHNYDGTIYGNSWIPGSCLNFDGVDDYVDFDNHSENLGYNKTDEYIIILWFKSSASGMIYSMSHTDPARPYFNLELNYDGKISVTMGDKSGLLELSTSGSYNDGNWHYVEMKFYGNTTNPTLEIYVDGELDGSITDWLPPMLNEDFKTAIMGRKSITATNYFNGIIDEVKVYKYPETSQPPPRLIIKGPIKGRAGTPYTYEFQLNTSDERDVSYYIRWGDGDITDWTIPLPSSTPYKETHTYANQGTFEIEAKARDSTGLESGWSSLTVTMPRHKAVTGSLFLWFLERFQLLERLLNLIK
jgi:hypothetical protein